MDVLHDIQSFETPRRGCALTIGNFDGVHLGHQQLLFTLGRLADEFSVQAVVITFEPHPLAILAPQRAPERLATPQEKLALLQRARIDTTIVIRSEPRFFSLSPDEFLSVIVEKCRPVAIVEGQRFNFGKDRAGSIETLRSTGEKLGFAVRTLDTIRCVELPDAPEVSSSAIRTALREGDVQTAAAMLGRPHRIVGTVAAGDARGRTIGFPTANLAEIAQMSPGHGVYAAFAQLDDGRMIASAVNVGPQPSFDQQTSRVEAHLIDFDGDLRGARLGLHFLARIRGQQRFDSIDGLKSQITRDVDQSRKIASEAGEWRQRLQQFVQKF